MKPKKTKKTKRAPLPVYESRIKWRRLKDELDACSREYPERTPYFYRKQAISWRQHLNFFEWIKGSHDNARYFAKMYLQSYRKAQQMWNDITAGIVKSDGISGTVPTEAARQGWSRWRKGVAA